MQHKVGYSLVDIDSNQELQFWGNMVGEIHSMPIELILPNKDVVYGFSVGEVFQNKYKFLERWIDDNKTTEWDEILNQNVIITQDKAIISYEYEIPPLDILKIRKKEQLANLRWQKEVGGIEIDENMYSTDRESQTKYTSIAVNLMTDPNPTWAINWKTADGKFVTLNREQMLSVINLVLIHVQMCYNRESELIQQIDNCQTISQLIELDISI